MICEAEQPRGAVEFTAAADVLSRVIVVGVRVSNTEYPFTFYLTAYV